MKQLFNTIKEIWHTERGRSLITILIWILFFLVMFLLLNRGDKAPTEIVITKDKYEYNMVFNINNQVYNVEGIRYENKELLEIKELHKEYINNFENIKQLYNFDIRYLRLENIEDLIYNLDSTRNISYNDGSSKVTYEVLSSDFKINDLDNYVDNLTNKVEVTYDRNNTIEAVDIDLTNKMKKINKNIKNYRININYKNIGNIRDFAID